jgi:hypothetical protein
MSRHWHKDKEGRQESGKGRKGRQKGKEGGQEGMMLSLRSQCASGYRYQSLSSTEKVKVKERRF